MKAAFLNAPNQLEVKDTPIPEPKPGELRIKLKKVGICGSDVHLFLGHRLLEKSTVIGHEGLGYIDKIGEGVSNRSIGERVVIEPNIPCHRCVHCLGGKGNICLNKRVIGVLEAGCFAEYITLPEAFCWAVPASITDENAVVVEPCAVAYHALIASQAKPGDAISVIGLGAIGLLLTHIALRLGYQVLVTEINATKVALAEAQGAIVACPPGNLEESTKALAKIWTKNEVCCVFECAGSHLTTTMAIEAAPRGAEVVIVGLANKPAQFIPLLTTREGISILPSIIYDHPFDFKRVIQLIASKTIDPSFIVSQSIALDDIQTALETAALGNGSKIVITIA
jgi:threonine dehydrogenase-like Zn-dependent dehydrogenase